MEAHPEPPVETGFEAGYDELPDDVGQLKAMVLAERARAARFEHILKLINRTTFSKRSEKLPADQLALVLEDEQVALAEAEGLQEKTAEEGERYGLKSAAAGLRMPSARRCRPIYRASRLSSSPRACNASAAAHCTRSAKTVPNGSTSFPHSIA